MTMLRAGVILALLAGNTLAPADPAAGAAGGAPNASSGATNASSGATNASAGDAAAGNARAADAASRSLPQSSVLASVSQSWKGADRDIVYGHFDLGERRYYCLIDAKSGKREPNGVLGDLFVQKDGTTAIHMSSVSLYACAEAQRAGYIETRGYQLTERAARALLPPAGTAADSTAGAPPSSAPAITPASVPAPAPAAAAPPAASSASPGTAVSSTLGPSTGASAAPSSASVTSSAAVASSSAPGASGQGAGKIDVGGVRLGMGVEEVRAAIRGRRLLNYWESLGAAGGRAAGAAASGAATGAARGAATGAASGARFVSRIAAWSAPDAAGDGESIEVLFTPVPGYERAYAIVHTVAYAPAHAVGQGALDRLLVKKYGGFGGAEALPSAPTWRLTRAAGIEAGDPCELRGLFGGLREVGSAPLERANSALGMPLEELQSQADRCGIAIVTEDHLSTSGSADRDHRRVVRFTISAYSPAIAVEGLKSAARTAPAGGGRELSAGDGSSPSLNDL
ncbi:MAG TPA: hypothetical protein VKT22_10685 [Steroidobacteraceae bacterium]|nr:hypothetical protein [Steroidobacteraceae bacterium]